MLLKHVSRSLLRYLFDDKEGSSSKVKGLVLVLE